MEKQKFWTVWSPRGGRAKVRHASFEETRDEAARLSAKFPGRHFYVMEMVGYAIVGDETLTRKQRKAVKKLNQTEAIADVVESFENGSMTRIDGSPANEPEVEL